jgi:hypothetical protein
MFNYQIKTYNPEIEVTEFHFFILNKGLNSGKPLLEPCPNCFVCTFKTEAEKEQLYWLVFGLWQGKAFYTSLLGSVIPYIRKSDVIDIVQNGIEKLNLNPEKVKKNISAVAKIEEQIINVLKQLDLMKQLKMALIFEVLK